MPPSSSSAELSKGQLKLTGAQETLLLTLSARAEDAELPNPTLNDQYALEVMSEIRDRGYDFRRTQSRSPIGMGSWVFAAAIAMRARALDILTQEFLRRHRGPATVLHLACGLDSRSHRVRWQGEGRLWVDADRQEVVELRRQVMGEPETGGSKPGSGGGGGGGGYRLIQPDIHDDAWLRDAAIPTDRPVLVVFEGLSMYLTDAEMYGLVRRIVDYFRQNGTHGEIVFDAMGSLAFYSIKYGAKTTLDLMGTRLYWYMDNPKLLEQKIPGLKLRHRASAVMIVDLFRFGLLGIILGFVTWLCDLFRISSRFGGVYGYVF